MVSFIIYFSTNSPSTSMVLLGTMPWSAHIAKFLMHELRCHHLKLYTTD